jgi:hypothetical protein
MERLQLYSQNEECVSKLYREKGNSDKCIQDLIEIFYDIGRDEPTRNFNESQFLSLYKTIFFDIQQFVNIDKSGNITSNNRHELLPNNIYRKLLVYLLINSHTYNQVQLDILYRLFVCLEENAIGGYMYISLKGRSYKSIIEKLSKNQIEQNYTYHILEKNSIPEKCLIICNTTLISLFGNLIQ